MEAEALLNALRDHVACCLPFSCAKKVLACFQLMANGDGRAWEHSQYESEMRGKKIRKNYLNHGKYLSWGARIAMDTFTVCSAGHQAYAFRTENEITLWTLFFYSKYSFQF